MGNGQTIREDDETVVANTHIVEVVEALEYGVSIGTTDSSNSGKPGETVWWRLEVENLGNVRDSYRFSVFGLGTDYEYRFKVDDSDVSEITLDPGEKETVLFEVDVPDVFTTIPTPNMEITVKVTSMNEATAIDNVVLQLELKGILDLTLVVTTSTNSPKVGQKVVFTVTVKNLGPDDATGVYVYAHFGDVIEKKSAGNVDANDETEITLEWFPLEEGSVQVRIEVNPPEEEGAIWELDYTNNEWVKPMRVSAPEEDSLLESGLFWIAMIVVVVVVIILIALMGGRTEEEEEEATEVVEVVEEDEEYDDEEYDDEDLDDDEDYEDDETIDEDEAEDDWDDGEEGPVEEDDEEAKVPFTGGRM